MAPLRYLVLGALGVLGLVLGVGACTAPGSSSGGGGGASGHASGSGGSAVACNVGPVEEGFGDCNMDEFTPTVYPECPKQPSGESHPLAQLLGCDFSGVGDCEPFWSSDSCPQWWGQKHYIDWALVWEDGASKSKHIGNVDILVKMTASGTFTVDWEGEELDDEEQPVGDPITGHADLPGLCCAVDFDIHLPVHDYTMRYRIQTDWEQPD